MDWMECELGLVVSGMIDEIYDMESCLGTLRLQLEEASKHRLSISVGMQSHAMFLKIFTLELLFSNGEIRQLWYSLFDTNI